MGGGGTGWLRNTLSLSNRQMSERWLASLEPCSRPHCQRLSRLGQDPFRYQQVFMDTICVFGCAGCPQARGWG